MIVRDLPDGHVEQLERGSIGTRLGEGLRERGALGDAAMQRTLDAVATFMERVRAHGAQTLCIATSAMRRASNRSEFSAQVAELTGVQPSVLEGAEEAACSYAGATFGAAAAKDVRSAVLDVGGGSTECAVGSGGCLEAATSLEIGAVRLSERFPQIMGACPGARALAAAGEARALARSTVAPFERFAPVGEVRAVGGTPLTLGAIALRCDADSVSGRVLDRDAIDGTVEHLLALDLEARREVPGMLAQRADILPAGGVILSESLRALGADSVVAEANDLLLGYLFRTGPTTDLG